MANVKTAISLEKPLLEQVDLIAHEMGIPRSRLFVLAVEEFLQRRQNKQIMETINKVYSEHPPTEREQAQLKEMRRHYMSTLEDEEW
jgi:metal-responsive CopG/Arc/MetJ family transcriptional regulator